MPVCISHNPSFCPSVSFGIITPEQDVLESSKLMEIFFDMVTGSAASRSKSKMLGHAVRTQNAL